MHATHPCAPPNLPVRFLGLRFHYGATENDAITAVHAIAPYLSPSDVLVLTGRGAPYLFDWMGGQPVMTAAAATLRIEDDNAIDVVLIPWRSDGIRALSAMTHALTRTTPTLFDLSTHSHHVLLAIDPYESDACDALDYGDSASVDAVLCTIRNHWRGPIGVLRRNPGASAWRAARLRQVDDLAIRQHLIAIDFLEIGVSPGITTEEACTRFHDALAHGIPALPSVSPLNDTALDIASVMGIPSAIHHGAPAMERLIDAARKALTSMPSIYMRRFDDEQRLAQQNGVDDLLWSFAHVGVALRGIDGIALARPPWAASMTLFALGLSVVDPIRTGIPLDARIFSGAPHMALPSDSVLTHDSAPLIDDIRLARFGASPLPLRADLVVPHPRQWGIFPADAPLPLHANGVALISPSCARTMVRVTFADSLMGLRESHEATDDLPLVAGDDPSPIPGDILARNDQRALFPLMHDRRLCDLIRQRSVRTWADVASLLAASSSTDDDAVMRWDVLELTRRICHALTRRPARYLAPLAARGFHESIRRAARAALATFGVQCIPPESLDRVRTVALDANRLQCGLDILPGWTSEMIARLEDNVRRYGTFSSLPITAARLSAIGISDTALESLLTYGLLQRIDPDIAGWRAHVATKRPVEATTGRCLQLG
jgi:hypothetical protein